jgi:hypothetical protein
MIKRPEGQGTVSHTMPAAQTARAENIIVDIFATQDRPKHDRTAPNINRAAPNINKTAFENFVSQNLDRTAPSGHRNATGINILVNIAAASVRPLIFNWPS